MKKIIVIGISGAGKSVLSRQVSQDLNLPLYHLDRIFHLPKGEMLDRSLFLAEQKKIMSQEAWIIDGNYAGSLPDRVAEADTIIWLDFPAWLCVMRVFKRSLRFRRDKQTRPDMASHFEERLFSREYVAFLYFVGSFNRKVRPNILAAVNQSSAHTELISLKNKQDVMHFLSQL